MEGFEALDEEMESNSEVRNMLVVFDTMVAFSRIVDYIMKLETLCAIDENGENLSDEIATLRSDAMEAYTFLGDFASYAVSIFSRLNALNSEATQDN